MADIWTYISLCLLSVGRCGQFNSSLSATACRETFFFYRLQRVSTNRLMERGPAHLAPFSPVLWRRRRHCRQKGILSTSTVHAVFVLLSEKTPQLLFPHRTWKGLISDAVQLYEVLNMCDPPLLLPSPSHCHGTSQLCFKLYQFPSERK